ncbi:MAG TPA: HD domain-containing phosphohydrolase [Gemmatimonadaceae bacterium]|nr:HD domain-containing phosphohydrolase [Gemmatimonadaceae bacterium]
MSLPTRDAARAARYSPYSDAVGAPAGAEPLLLAPVGRALAIEMALATDRRLELRRVDAVPRPEDLEGNRPVVLLLDARLAATPGGRGDRLHELAERAALVWLGDPGETEPPASAPVDLLTGWLAPGLAAGAQAVTLTGAFRHAVALVAARRAREDEASRTRELGELARVGAALATERDLLVLLDAILSQARRITCCDAGSLYLVERTAGNESAPRTLRFKLAQNHSRPEIPFQEYSVPVDASSLAGHAALTGEPLVIDDVYTLDGRASYRLNRSFDDRFGYRTKSMLVVPMTTHREEVVGVLQLINRKRAPELVLETPEAVERDVLPFDAHAVELAGALAAQAGVAIENGLLYEDIERLFEGFVTAAVTAIEARDPATSGHSARVATMTVGLAEAVDRGGTGRYRGIRFTREQLRELRYAGLLHDFGKVGVREQVLVKGKKLYDGQLELIRHRFAFAQQSAELAFERGRAEHLRVHGQRGYDEAVAWLEAERDQRRDRLMRYFDAVLEANEPTVLPADSFDELRAIQGEQYVDFDGIERPLLSDDELRYLMVRQGTLDERERREIESHVTHTYRFLEQIPWTRELRGIPEIAYAHHEKLNGRGYPRAIGAEAIPVQARMMTIADIYDALTATDRPYKRAVPTTQALDILHAEAREGMLDPELLATFVDAGVWRGGPTAAG